MSDPQPLLYDANLQTCPDEWLQGRWLVRRRGPGGPAASAAGAMLINVGDRLELTPTQRLLLTPPPPATPRPPGAWAITRDPRLRRPYLDLTLPGAAPGRALVTRLRRSPDGQAAALTLYLQTGVELALELENIANS